MRKLNDGVFVKIEKKVSQYVGVYAICVMILWLDNIYNQIHVEFQLFTGINPYNGMSFAKFSQYLGYGTVHHNSINVLIP